MNQNKVKSSSKSLKRLSFTHNSHVYPQFKGHFDTISVPLKVSVLGKRPTRVLWVVSKY